MMMDGERQPQRTIVLEARETHETRPPPIWSLQLIKAERLSILKRYAPGQPFYEQAFHAFLEADAELQKALVDRFGLDTIF
jgi:hypothetical protein